jgi:hypothetical protein
MRKIIVFGRKTLEIDGIGRSILTGTSPNFSSDFLAFLRWKEQEVNFRSFPAGIGPHISTYEESQQW